MIKIVCCSLVLLMGCTSLSYAQNKREIPATYPIIDIHMHSAIKPFNSRDVADYNLWETFDHTCEGKMSKMFLNGSDEVPRYTQCNLESMLKGNVRLGYLSLTPLEKGMLEPKLINVEKKGVATMACISGVQATAPLPEDKELQYFDDLVENIHYVRNGASIPYTIDSKTYTYELVKTSEDIQRLLEDDSKIALLFNIEGGHALGHSLELEDVSNTTAYQEMCLTNLKRLKGMIPLEDGKDYVLEYPILSMNLNHFFWNGIGGHATTFSGSQTLVFNQKKGLDEPLTDWGKELIKLMLDRSDGRRMLVDVKHMSLDARKWYYKHLEELRAKGDTVGIVSSHSSAAGISWDQYDYTRKDNNNKNKNSWTNRWIISLSDEDVIEIHKSKGLIGIMLDKYRLVGGLGKQELKKLEPGSEQQRAFFVKSILLNAFECVDAVGEKSAWDLICIGSDFDGLVNPPDTYTSSSDFPDLQRDIIEFLQAPTDLWDVFTSEQLKEMMYGYTPEEIAYKIMYENAYLFTLRQLDAIQPVVKK